MADIDARVSIPDEILMNVIEGKLNITSAAVREAMGDEKGQFNSFCDLQLIFDKDESLSEKIDSLYVEKQHEIVGTDIVPECIDDSLSKVNSRADDSIKFNDEGGSAFSKIFYSLKENKKEVIIVGVIVAIISSGPLIHKYIKKRKSKEEKRFRIALNKYIEAIKGDNLETEIIDELLESIIALRKRKKSKNISIQLSLDELEIILKNKYHDITAAEMTKVNENDNTNNNVILSFEKYLKIQREILDKSA